ncbi:MAG: hypothetical protein EBT68_07430 [Verrucomicrobia bacterium]|nr:hypothetical protein [Verrucomicrobiota bacterium]NBR63279.1 hypothetical protein [Verrucomicrobiota bacterium]
MDALKNGWFDPYSSVVDTEVTIDQMSRLQVIDAQGKLSRRGLELREEGGRWFIRPAGGK